MKKIILSLALLMGTMAYAQEEGQLYLGGSLGFNSASSSIDGISVPGFPGLSTPNQEASTFTWNLSPEVGYFLTDEWALGLSLGIGSVNSTLSIDSLPDLEANSSNFSVGVYGRRIWDLDRNLSLFTSLNIGFTSGSVTSFELDTISNPVDLNTFAMGVDVGVIYNLSDRFWVMAQYGLIGFSSSSSEGMSMSDFGFNVNGRGPVFNLGLYYAILD